MNTSHAKFKSESTQSFSGAALKEKKNRKTEREMRTNEAGEQ